MEKNQLRENRLRLWGRICFYAVFSLFFLWLAAQVPYTHDDWDWGLGIGWQQLLTANINSRYAGNLLEVIMTRSSFLKTIFMAVGYFFVPFLASTIATDDNEHQKKKKPLYFLLCTVLIFLMNRKIWQQTYGWVAGFANFVTATIFLLFFLKEGLTVFDEIDTTKNRINLKCVALFLGSIIGQLFLENVAVFMVLFSLTISVIYYIRTRSVSRAYLFLTLGTIIGLGILFSSSIYGQLLSTGDAVNGYRHVHISANTSIGEFITSICIQAACILFLMLKQNLLAYACILLVLNIALILKKQRGIWAILFFCINSAFLLFFALYAIFGIAISNLILCIANVCCILTITGQLILLFKDNKPLLGKLLLVWFSAFAVVAPLVITNESGPRLFLTPLVLLILLAIMLLHAIHDTLPNKLLLCGAICSIAVAVALTAFYGKVYYDIGACTARRNAIISQAIEDGEKEITLPEYPHQSFLWLSTPTSERRMQFFKEFFEIPQDITVIFE